MIPKALALVFLFAPVCSAMSQKGSEIRGASVFEEYDRSHITPELRRKHAITIGFQEGVSTPFSKTFTDNPDGSTSMNWNPGIHIGYNFLIIRKRKRLLSPTGKQANEIKNGLGVHLYMQQNKEFYFNISYYRPIIKLYIPIFRIYLFNEFGLGLYYNSNFVNFGDGKTKPLTPAASIQPLSVRLSNSPIFFYITAVYSLKNNLFGTEPLSVSFLGGVKVYFYKYH